MLECRYPVSLRYNFDAIVEAGLSWRRIPGCTLPFYWHYVRSPDGSRTYIQKLWGTDRFTVADVDRLIGYYDYISGRRYRVEEC